MVVVLGQELVDAIGNDSVEVDVIDPDFQCLENPFLDVSFLK